MTDETQSIGPTELKEALAGDQAPLVIDVLSPASWEAHRVRGAHNACVYEVAFGGKVEKLVADRATPLVVYGASDATQEAVAAAAKLTAAGYTDVRVLDGGLDSWCRVGFATEGAADAPLPSPGPPVLGDGSWKLDTEGSSLRFVGRNPNGFHDGAIDVTEGKITMKNGKARGRFTVDPRTIKNFDLKGNKSQQALIGHLLSDDFIFADKFPDVVFVIESVKPIAGAAPTSTTHRVDGNLELRGVKAPVDFDATVSRAKDGAVAVESHFDIDRTDWGMTYGSARFFAHLGMHVVYDDVSIALRLVLQPV